MSPLAEDVVPEGDHLGKHHLATRFFHGTLRMRPTAQVRVQARYLTIVLEGLSFTPFEPFDTASDKYIALKMAFLLVMSLKRFGDLKALSVAPPFWNSLQVG